jgi:hypothetical protein
MSNFLACRLCKGLSISIVNGISKCYAECDKCGAYGPDADSHADAMHAWNTLANDSARKIAETLASANELFDLARMKKALSGESYQVPSGITREQFKELIASHAPPDTPVPAVHAQEPVLHDAIMNLPLGPAHENYSHHLACRMAYKEGHKDARHAAAELVVASRIAPPDAQAIMDQAYEDAAAHFDKTHRELLWCPEISKELRAMIGKPTGEVK